MEDWIFMQNKCLRTTGLLLNQRNKSRHSSLRSRELGHKYCWSWLWFHFWSPTNDSDTQLQSVCEWVGGGRWFLTPILTLSTWKYHQIPQVKAQSHKTALTLSLQMSITSRGCPLYFWPISYRSEFPNWAITLLEWLRELRNILLTRLLVYHKRL